MIMMMTKNKNKIQRQLLKIKLQLKLLITLNMLWVRKVASHSKEYYCYECSVWTLTLT